MRKELLGTDPSTRLAAPYAEGIYRPEHTDATYREVRARARARARARHRPEPSESVILDAFSPTRQGVSRRPASHAPR